MEVITLENMNVATIYKVFEDAFTDYFVKFEKKADAHIQRWLTAGVDFSLLLEFHSPPMILPSASSSSTYS